MTRRAIVVLVAFLAAGCAETRGPEAPTGPLAAAAVRLEPSDFSSNAKAIPAWRVVTTHYLLETTLADSGLAESLGQLMEGALEQYQSLAPGMAASDKPMECFIFASRTEWAQFTKAHTGSDAEIYLKINRGGYAVRDWYVAYFIGDLGTYSVAAHEGWHQYVARHFKRRPPPFLEEGLATLFEIVAWDNGLPRWRLSVNPTRLAGLERTFKRRANMPLHKLCEMHAGQVVSEGPARVEAFYSQSWAFARFLSESNGGKYRDALRDLLEDAAAGRSWNSEESTASLSPRWNPRTAKPMLEHYLHQSLDDIDREYNAYMRGLLVNDRSG